MQVLLFEEPTFNVHSWLVDIEFFFGLTNPEKFEFHVLRNH